VGIMALSGCGGGVSNGTPPPPPTLSGNWQFTMGEQLDANPAQPSFTGGLQGGFLLQSNGSVTGQAVFLIMTAPPFGSGGVPTVCNSGIDQITGTVTNQSVSLTAVSTGAQTYTLTGTLSFDGSTMAGSYSSTDGAGCGTAATQSWSAALVPTISGPILGEFHSAGGTAGLNEQDFLVSGALIQETNTGASSAIVTGNLNFLNALTNLSDYPCFSVASVRGQISGSSVFLQVIGDDGSNIGQIGQDGPLLSSGPQVVSYESTQNGNILKSLAGTGYAAYAPTCGGGSLESPADYGEICLAVNSPSACQQPITLTPSALIFPDQAVDSPATYETITLANTYGSTLGGLTVALSNSGQANFTETDTCGLAGTSSQGQPFILNANQSCTVTIAFSPLQECADGALPGQCLTATISVTSPNNDAVITLPIAGEVSAGAASVGGFNFGAEGLLDASVPPTVKFTNPIGHSAQSLPNSSARPFQDEKTHAEND
jgi:hypothetical protein